MKVGIPCGLLYYSYYPLAKTFFEELGAEVVTSGNTNKSILNYGAKLCVDEACLPVKVFHGHVESLKNRADMLFIPRIMSIAKNEYICPKFCGLPEMIKNSIPDLPPIIQSTVNLRKSAKSIYDSIMDAAGAITKDKGRIMAAYVSALKVQGEFEKKLKSSGNFFQSLGVKKDDRPEFARRIAIIGHPYNIYDDFINMDIKKKIIKEGYGVLVPEMLDEELINRYAVSLPKRHFWTFGRRILGTGLSLINQCNVSGIIYLSSFGCGIDSLMEDYLERQVRRDGRVPYMKLILDEHTGDAGMGTRLEAFIDMVRWREQHESNISPYGGSIHSSKILS